MDPDVADEIYELERCVECGLCVRLRYQADAAGFLSAVGFMRLAIWLRPDPRDKRTDEEFTK